jgi:hypothetical protein
MIPAMHANAICRSDRGPSAFARGFGGQVRSAPLPLNSGLICHARAMTSHALTMWMQTLATWSASALQPNAAYINPK